jgi:uncharacterized SAM-binding protein YcdF (DUF218 family)
MDQKKIDNLARKIWDYQQLHQVLEKADAILVLGSYNLKVPEYAAKLFLEGWAPLIVFSGKSGRNTSKAWNKSEAEMFADVAMQAGVPKEKIILETESTNTGENILFTKELLTKKRIDIQKFILVQKPYMERRAYVTFKKCWPNKEVIVTSPPIPFEEYADPGKSPKAFISQLVGDLQRIKVYADKGWQIPQEIPEEVWDAYEKLLALGYTNHLFKEQSDF